MSQIKHKEELLKQKEAEVRNLYNQVRRMRNNSIIRVTDHAIVRFLERHYKIDMKKIEDEMVTKQVEEMYSKLGDGIYPIDNGTTRVVIEKGIVVTIYI
jgi:hypothetical protein